MMQVSLPASDLEHYVHRLVAHHLPDGYSPPAVLSELFGRALERVEHCFSRIHRRYYRQGDVVLFDHLNADHMAALLYFYGGSVRFGKLTMSDADMWLIDADPRDPFDFYPEQYMRQLVAGYSKNTPEGGLRVYMPDYHQAAHTNLRPAAVVH